MTDSLDEMGFPKPGRAIDEQGVVARADFLGSGHGGRMGKFVAVSDNKRVKGIFRIEVRHRIFPLKMKIEPEHKVEKGKRLTPVRIIYQIEMMEARKVNKNTIRDYYYLGMIRTGCFGHGCMCGLPSGI